MSTVSRLSNSSVRVRSDEVVLVMTGSFAPVHEGHIEATTAALSALEAKGDKIAGVVYAPTSDSYLSSKLSDESRAWGFERRVALLLNLPEASVPVFIDDLSGVTKGGGSTTQKVLDSVSRRLDTLASQLILVTGTDQAASMKPYLSTNRAVCVVRPGVISPLLALFGEEWFHNAVLHGRWLFTERLSQNDISSTEIRKALKTST